MFSGITMITPPAVEPVTLDQLKAHLRIDHNDDDGTVVMYGQSARVWAERYLNRTLINTGLICTLRSDADPGSRFGNRGPTRWAWPIELPRSPLVSIDSVTLNDIAGLATVLPTGAYFVQPGTDPARLCLDYSTTSLIVPGQPLDSVQVAFTAGYGADATKIPTNIINAILVAAAFLYENRGDSGGEMPRAAQWLLDPDRVAYFGG